MRFNEIFMVIMYNMATAIYMTAVVVGGINAQKSCVLYLVPSRLQGQKHTFRKSRGQKRLVDFIQAELFEL